MIALHVIKGKRDVFIIIVFFIFLSITFWLYVERVSCCGLLCTLCVILAGLRWWQRVSGDSIKRSLQCATPYSICIADDVMLKLLPDTHLILDSVRYTNFISSGVYIDYDGSLYNICRFRYSL